MRDIASWVMGVISGLFALIGLFLASRAIDDVTYWIGLAIFAFGVLFILSLVARATRSGAD